MRPVFVNEHITNTTFIASSLIASRYLFETRIIDWISAMKLALGPTASIRSPLVEAGWSVCAWVIAGPTWYVIDALRSPLKPDLGNALVMLPWFFAIAAIAFVLRLATTHFFRSRAAHPSPHTALAAQSSSWQAAPCCWHVAPDEQHSSNNRQTKGPGERKLAGPLSILVRWIAYPVNTERARRSNV